MVVFVKICVVFWKLVVEIKLLLFSEVFVIFNSNGLYKGVILFFWFVVVVIVVIFWKFKILFGKNVVVLLFLI